MKILLMAAMLILFSFPCYAMSISGGGMPKVYNIPHYASWGSGAAVGSTGAYVHVPSRSIQAAMATLGPAAYSRLLLTRTAGVLPYVGIAATGYLTYKEIINASKASPTLYPQLSEAATQVTAGTWQDPATGNYYTTSSTTVNTDVWQSSTPPHLFNGLTQVYTYDFIPTGQAPKPATQVLYHVTTSIEPWHWNATKTTTTYTFKDIDSAMANKLQSYDAANDPVYMDQLDQMMREATAGANYPTGLTDTEAINALKDQITAINDAHHDAEVAKAAAHSAAQESATSSKAARENVTREVYNASGDPTNTQKAADASQAARDNAQLAATHATNAAIDRNTAEAALHAAEAAAAADENNQNARDAAIADQAALDQAKQAATEASNNAAIANDLLNKILAAEQASIAANNAAAEKAAAAVLAASAAAAAAANPGDPVLAAAAAAAAANASQLGLTADQAAQNAAALAAANANAAANAQAQASAAAAEAAAQAAAEQAAADAANASANPGEYNTDIEAPEKKDIPQLLASFFANSPLAAMVRSFTIDTTDTVSSVSCGTVYGREVVFDFVRYAPTFSYLGGMLLVIVHGFAVLVVVRGW